MDSFEFPAGATIFNAGDQATRAFLIRAGAVELERDIDGSVVCVAQLHAGDLFGEMSLVEERPYAMTARARDTVQLSGLTRSEFEQLQTADPATFRLFLNALFERLRTLSSQIESHSTAHSTTANEISVTIHPLTRRAAATLPRDGLSVTKYPFRIGRAAAENEEIPLDVNDLWLNDQLPFSISRNHALIEIDAGEVILKDRGSSLGMYVNDIHIGGKSHDRQMELEDGDNIVTLGGRMSPYQFRIHVSRAH